MDTRWNLRPSASMVVAIIALVVAASGTAIAAGKLVSGDSLIKKHSLSANRLRNHTLSGTQIDLSKLGKVPSASHADSSNSAITATTALTANTASSATTAAAANSLNGIQIVAGPSTPNTADSQDNETVVCPAGMSVIGGGVQASGGVEEAINEEIIFSTSGGTNNALTIYVNNISGAGTPPVFAAVTDHFHVYAVCVRGSVGGQAF